MNFLFPLFCIVSLSAATINAHAQPASLEVTATIIEPVQISCPSALRFGSLDVSGQADEIVLSPQGQVSARGTVQNSGGDSAEPGLCLLTGAPNQQVHLEIQSSQLQNDDGAGNMTLSGITIDGGGNITALGGDNFAVTIPSSGMADLSVGASLNVQSGQAAGTYRGHVTVTANYQ